jgi:sigma-E factor negative regulatory protein RseA
MNKDTLEHLSSLMDGELTQETGMFVARRLGADREMGAAWERYHLIRECLRRPGGRWSASGLTVDIERWQSGEHTGSTTKRGANRWLRPVSGFAIAASVALLAVLTVLPEPVPEGVTPTLATKPFVSPNSANISPLSQYSQAASHTSDENNKRLSAYLLRHNQVAGSVGRQGFIALVPIVTTTPVQVLDPPSDTVEEPEPTEIAASDNQP